jgi:hypothetical protein
MYLLFEIICLEKTMNYRRLLEKERGSDKQKKKTKGGR